MSEIVTTIDIQGKLPKVASGKVRDLFAVDDGTLLFVASDRISAYDVIMENGIPGKGALLTAMSIYWFNYLPQHVPGLKTHYISNTLPGPISSLTSFKDRSMQVRRLRIIPIESIVRGYITGSGWSEYKKSGTVNGIKLPAGLIEGQKLPQPLWTPSTKAELGDKDENISPEKAREIIADAKIAARVEQLSLAIYEAAAKRAESVGIVLADTKFEFGLDEKDEVVLVDEVLTPDSSRFWPKDTWEQNLGKAQPSFDKQFLRDWLTSNGLKGKDGVKVPEEIVQQTAEKYREAYEKIAGKSA
ncbi:phosphoribosylaminoimidazole-succinocarboxamide synthase [Didymella exigua CBS 183.55]|uniref:Phosphoribosylaminoimidazole-succinocarboxamide synthase n=1 Tax=Didymella exigua CBS 183.55 TaxID=1150837 RepID=A0A6A5S4G6_9PLEO|nr:phosphoribosylaminoimidazole-succinocarboxamide synthase [Didymella exigua CBS 183.55]KAF1934344.1 phosphoribosylaminoimidazole-succinocarboxamide synthase [Didymella exigua CBS 183.55]